MSDPEREALREPNVLAGLIVLHLWRHPKHDPECRVCGYIKSGRWPK